jgi:hypothetical protein
LRIPEDAASRSAGEGAGETGADAARTEAAAPPKVDMHVVWGNRTGGGTEAEDRVNAVLAGGGFLPPVGEDTGEKPEEPK